LVFVKTVAMSEISKHEKGLFRVMVIGTELSFGILAAVIASMKGYVGGSGDFQFSYKTVLVFFLAASPAGLFGGWFAAGCSVLTRTGSFDLWA